jgi:hypothetical protein
MGRGLHLTKSKLLAIFRDIAEVVVLVDLT